MPPVDKAKAAGISASSFFDLKAELAKKEEEFAKNKAAAVQRTGAGTGKLEGRLIVKEKRTTGSVSWAGES